LFWTLPDTGATVYAVFDPNDFCFMTDEVDLVNASRANLVAYGTTRASFLVNLNAAVRTEAITPSVSKRDI
jgi:hypothetical protein